MTAIFVRPARTQDVRHIHALLDPLVGQRILLGKEMVSLYEAVQEFVVVEMDGEILACGALHVMWENLGEIRTLLVNPAWARRGLGGMIVTALEARARELGLSQLFCLTFEVDFFARYGFETLDEKPVVTDEVYAQLLRSPDAGVAEFLDLAHVKPNTLGNTRMLKQLS